MNKTTSTIGVVIKAIDKVSKPIRRINERVSRLREPIRRASNAFRSFAREAGMTKLVGATKRLGSALAGVGHEVLGLAKKFALLALVPTGGLFGLAKSTADYGNTIAKTADKIGMGTEAMQAWHYAAERAGVGTEVFDLSMQRLGRRVGEAAAGSGEALPAMKALHIAIRNSKGQVRSIESLLPEMADKLSKLKNANIRNALAMKFFDTDGVVLVNLLRYGSKGIKKFTDAARRMGLVLSDDAVRGAEKFHDAWIDITSVLLGLKRTISIKLLPVFEKWMNTLTHYLVKNQQRIIQASLRFIRKIPDIVNTIRHAFATCKQVLSPLVHVLLKVISYLGGMKAVAIGLALVVGSKLLRAILGVVAALRVLAVVVVSNPILAIISLIAMGALWVITHWKKVSAFFKDCFATIKSGFTAVWDAIKKFFHWIKKKFVAMGHFIKKYNPFSSMARSIKGIMNWFHDSDKPVKKLQSHVKALGHELAAVAQQKHALLGSAMGFSFNAQGIVLPNVLQSATPRAAAHPPAKLTVSFENAPKGTRIQHAATPAVDLDVTMGLQMMGE